MSNDGDSATCSDMDALARVCLFLGRLWELELDSETLRELHDTSIGDEYTNVGGVVPLMSPTILEELAIDFCQLFIGPTGHLPPYQSVWQEGGIHGGPTASMHKYIELLNYSEAQSVAMVDSLGFELTFMGWMLTYKPIDEQSELMKEIRHQYFQDHLRWPTKLLRSAHERAQSTFYRQLMTVTEDFLGSLGDVLM